MYSISLAAGNIDAGKTKSASCAACHGNNGVSAQDLYPNLAGQKARYIVKQLRAFESGARPEPTMAAMASVLSDVDMADLAAYYSSLVPRQQPALSTAPPTASSQAAEADLKNERPEGSAQIALTCPLGQAMYVHAPKTLNRLSKEEYKRTIWDLVGEQTAISLPALAGIIEGIPDDDVSAGFSNIDWSLSTDHVAGYLGVANELGVQIVKKKALRDKVIPCSKGGEHVTSELCISGFIDSFGARAYRRPLEQVEKQRLLTFYHGHSASNPDLALSSLVTRILMSPHFLFRHETAPPRESASCNQSLRTESFIRAARLSYGLWGSMPDGRLFSAASDNELLHESKLTNEIERMLADPKARSWLSQFFRQWLHYDHLAVEAYSLPFIGDIDRAHLHENAAEELDSFIDYVVWKERGNFARLMTSRKVITTSSALREIYELPRPHISPESTMPPNRAGLLTRAVMLAKGHDEDSLVRRGKFIRQQILCEPLKPPDPSKIPPGTLVPPVPDYRLTTRQRWEEKTAPPLCQSCHYLINPFGFALEAYDGLGRHRLSEKTLIPDSSPPAFQELLINTSITPNIESTNEAHVEGPVGLSEAIAKSEKANVCFVKQLTTFVARREITQSDTATVKKLAKQMMQADGSIYDVLIGVMKHLAVSEQSNANALASRAKQ